MNKSSSFHICRLFSNNDDWFQWRILILFVFPQGLAPSAARRRSRPELEPRPLIIHPPLIDEPPSTKRRKKRTPKPPISSVYPINMNSIQNQHIRDNIESCLPCINVLKGLQTALGDAIKHLLEYEHSLLTLAGYPNCSEGIVCALAFRVCGQVVCLYFETGRFTDFLEFQGRDYIQNVCNGTSDNCAIIEMFSRCDVQGFKDLYTAKRSEKASRDRRYTIYNRNLPVQTSSVLNCLNALDSAQLPDNVTSLGYFIQASHDGGQSSDGRKKKKLDDAWYTFYI